MSENLFAEFPPTSASAWKQKIQSDLKGEDYNQTLIWNSLEGIAVKPFYTAEENPTLFPDFASPKTTRVSQIIFVQDAKKSNTNAINAITNGAESLVFILPNTAISIEELFQNIEFNTIEIHIKTRFLKAEYVLALQVFFKKNKFENYFIHTDILQNLAATGNWYFDKEKDHKIFESIINSTKTISVDTSLYQNAGANIVQQLAYGMAQANEYFNLIASSTTTLKNLKNNRLTCIFTIAIGSNYFFEIAKIRAFRWLLNTISEAYSFSITSFILAQPTHRNKTIYDYNTNLLRTTSECMSAFLGRANTISNLAYDAIYHKTNEFGTRIARNQLLILKNEAYFDAVENPSDGSYYIESLTQQLAEKALQLFKNIENNNGFYQQLKEGTIQRKIKERAAKEQALFDTEKIIAIGTNIHPNANDRMKDELELYPFLKSNPRKTIIEPILTKRLAEKIEQKRLQTEK